MFLPYFDHLKVLIYINKGERTLKIYSFCDL